MARSSMVMEPNSSSSQNRYCTRLCLTAPFDSRTSGPATRQTSQRLPFTLREGVMLAVTGTRAPPMAGGFSNPTTPKTFCHQAGDREAISSEDR